MDCQRPVDKENPVLGAFVWMNQNRWYLIFTEVSMDKGQLYTCMRWSQEEPESNTDPNIIELTIPQPITAEIYYGKCGKIDRHNRCHQESLYTKKKVTKDWLKRFNLSLFCNDCGQCMVGIPMHQ